MSLFFKYGVGLVLFVVVSCERPDLDRVLEQKKERLGGLAQYGLRGEVGAIGYRSLNRKEHREEWVQVDFGKVELVDQVVLVPSIRRDSQTGLQADGFPEEFELVIGAVDGREVRVSQSVAEEAFLPRIAPLVIPLAEPVEARWVRVEGKKLSQIGWNRHYCLALSELMAFSGKDNVALRGRVSASSSNDYRGTPSSRDRRYLVDGHLPYRMDSPQGGKSLSYISVKEEGEVHEYQLDLGEERELDVLRLHRIAIDDTIPQSEAGDYGVPKKVKMVGSLREDFSDGVVLLETGEVKSIYEIGPVMAYRLSGERVRYVKFSFTPRTVEQDRGKTESVVGFSEVEIFSEGRNVALHKRFTGGQGISKLRSVEGMTDGMNYYGLILGEREWVEELAQRHELEREIPQIEGEVIRSYAGRKRGYALVGAGMLFLILASGWLSWYRPRRERRMMRERMAADIHDELGANLHTIAFISDGLKEEGLSREDILDIQGRIRHVSERTGRAVYHMSGVLEDEHLYRGLVDDMGRAVERILNTHQHEFKIEGRERLEKVGKELQVDLLLFYQECLVNIGRHSDADQFETSLVVGERQLVLEIRDFAAVHDAVGLEDGEKKAVVLSRSLQRRAKLLRGKLEVSEPSDGGLKVRLVKRLKVASGRKRAK